MGRQRNPWPAKTMHCKVFYTTESVRRIKIYLSILNQMCLHSEIIYFELYLTVKRYCQSNLCKRKYSTKILYMVKLRE